MGSYNTIGILKIIGLIGVIFCGFNAKALVVNNLQTEYLNNPIGIDVKIPHFSWQLKSEQRSTIQKSYQIKIGKDPSMTEVLFDSGIVESQVSVNVEFEDLSLEPCTRYYWNVVVTDNHGETAKSPSDAFFETGLMESGWNDSKWITTDNKGQERSSPRFRKSFKLNDKVRNARFYSSALGIYTLYINNTRIGEIQPDGNIIYDELMPGWTDYRKTIFYITYDVTSLLHEGENAIGAEVSSGWWLGEVNHGIYDSSRPAFIGKLVIELENGETQIIDSDTSWLYSYKGAIIDGDIYNGEIFDSRLADKWTSPDYGTEGWDMCVEDKQLKGALIGHLGPTVRIRPDLERQVRTITIYDGIKDNGTTYGEINTVAVHSGNISVALHKGQTLVADFGQNASGWAKFKVIGKAGTELHLRYAEMINDSGEAERGNDGAKGSLYTIALRSAKAQGKYILSGNEDGEVYRPTSTFYGFRYCDITTTEDMIIEWITAETISSQYEERSYVTTDNNDVNKLFSNIIWSQRSNFVSIPTDCPQRDERLGWGADAQVFSMTAMYNAHLQGFFHKWMRDMRDGQLPTGEFPDVAPYCWERNVTHGSSGWADAGIIIPWNVYIMYGDKSIITENYDSMVRYMDWLDTRNHGESRYMGAKPTYGDWLAFESTDKEFVSIVYYAYMAEIMSRMSKIISNVSGDYFDTQAKKYTELFSEIRCEFLKRYWDEEANSLSLSTQCALLMSLRYNLLPNDEAIKKVCASLRKSIEQNGNRLSTGFLGTSIINQTLSDNQMDDLAFSLLLQHECPSWLYCVDQGATTTWERWDSYTLENGFNKSSWMNSYNHYAYGAVGEWLYRNMAGITTDYDNPGFKHILLRPVFDIERRIADMEASFASNYGDIVSKYKCGNDGSYTYTVSIPANTFASLNLPSNLERDMTLFEGLDPAIEADGISDFFDNGVVYSMSLGSGTYNFTYGIKPTSSNKKIANQTINTYPNPATDIVTIKSDKEISNIELRSLNGSLIAESKKTDYINVVDCPTGIYLLIVTTIDGDISTVKLIKN